MISHRATGTTAATLISVVAYLGLTVWAVLTSQYVLLSLLFLLPISLMGVYLAVFHFRNFLYFTVFCIPLSIGVKDLGGGFGAVFPGEVMLALAAVIAGIKLLSGPFLARSTVQHPVTAIIGLQVVWIAVTAATSSEPLISVKFLGARLVYLLVFYFLFMQLFRDPRHMSRFLWMYLAGFVPVMLYSLNRLSGWGLSRSFSPSMAEPFFDDHTVFGACLAMLLPVAVLFWRRRRTYLEGFRFNWLIIPATPLVLLSLALSFSRAAWMSVIVALGMYLILLMRIRFRWLATALIALTVVVWVNQDSLVRQLQRNKTASSEDVLETAVSVTNVSTDESNMERVNRWSSALRMFAERPWLGWGPGTYEVNYGVFQISTEKTRISTNRGDRGDAHSEYLGVLAEQGLPGLALKLLLFLALIKVGMRAYYRHTDPRLKHFNAALILGLVTYFFHGGVNSFLDIDKAASLFWTMAGMIVVLDILAKKSTEFRQNY